MSKLPIISAQDLEKILSYLGFQCKRQLGSKCFLPTYRWPDYGASFSSGPRYRLRLIEENTAGFTT